MTSTPAQPAMTPRAAWMQFLGGSAMLLLT